MRGHHRKKGTLLYLVVEVSVRVDTEDVERAIRRRDLMSMAGHAAVPVEVGESIHVIAEELACSRGVEYIGVNP